MSQYIDIHLIHFALTVVFSFLIGLEIKSYRLRFHKEQTKNTIGSTRTYTLLGIIGYLFFILDEHYLLYITGLIGFTLLFALFYMGQLKHNQTSILLYLVGLIVYSFGPLSERFPLWMVSLLFVLTIFILNAKKRLQDFSQHININEFETLGKMVLLSAVILPLLPHQKIGGILPVSPFQIWLAVVIISAISYGGYLMQTYLFKEKGYLLAGILGGIYSSTATTVVMSRKMAETGFSYVLTASVIAASAMMYLRLIIVAAFFNLSVAKSLSLLFFLFFVLGIMIALFYAKHRAVENEKVVLSAANPLELGTAFVFSALFIAMVALTQFVTAHFGSSGLNILSFLVGFTDIDPFVLSILTGKAASVSNAQIVSAIMIAAGSNNILKAIYAVWFGTFQRGWHAALWLIGFGIATISYALVIV